MASLRRLLVLVLLGTARAAAGDACNEDGSSAAYTETITTQLRAEQHAVSGEPAFVAGRRVVVFLPEGLVAS